GRAVRSAWSGPLDQPGYGRGRPTEGRHMRTGSKKAFRSLARGGPWVGPGRGRVPLWTSGGRDRARSAAWPDTSHAPDRGRPAGRDQGEEATGCPTGAIVPSDSRARCATPSSSLSVRSTIDRPRGLLA